MTTVDSEVLLQLFRALSPVKLGGPEQFAAAPIPGYKNHRIARDAHARACLLLGVVDAGRSGSPPPIVLRHVEVQNDVHCTIRHADGGTEAAIFTVIRCLSENPLLQSMFLRVCMPVLEQLGPQSSRAGVLDAINRLVELFRNLEKPAAKTIVGLWAELFLVDQSADPKLMISSWHSAPEEIFDFSCGPQRIEVKASSRRSRAHHFRLEQLQPPSGACGIVASLFVNTAGRGAGITELVERIGGRISDIALQDRLYGLVFQLLGENWETGVVQRFDYQAAEESLSFYPASQIPCITLPVPQGVSDVHFVADLSSLEAISSGRLRMDGGLFAAACGKAGG